jgi:Mg2+-importing ATPase
LLIEGKNADFQACLFFAIALAVSVIPESLAPCCNLFSFSRRVAVCKKGVIVKRISSVQDLGYVILLCYDKTGTITEKRLTFKTNLFFQIPN